MSVLSVDLACRSWSDLGVVLLEQKGATIACDIIHWNEPYPPPVIELALRLNQVCHERGSGVLMLDGPQAWTQSPNTADVSRVQQQDPARVKQPAGGPVSAAPLPGSYERFVGYCLALYDALGRLGWQRLSARATARNPGTPQKILVESYPQAAWKSLDIPPLPLRHECRVSHLAEAYAALTQILPITTSQPPNHSQLQAIAGGLPGLAIEERSVAGRAIAESQPLIWEIGQWRDGVADLPAPPKARNIPRPPHDARHKRP